MSKQVILDSIYLWETPQEEANAQIFQPSNLQFIKTQLSIERRRLATLKPDPDSYQKYIQEHAGISGAISAYELLINCHEDQIKRLSVDSPT